MDIGIKEEGNLICLFFFTRAYETKAKDDAGRLVKSYRREWVRCRLWFKGTEDLKQFLSIHQPVTWHSGLFDNAADFAKYDCENETIETTWPAYYTMTAQQLGFSKEKK